MYMIIIEYMIVFVLMNNCCSCCFSPSFPLHVNKVAGIVGRADLLCALFFQLSFLTYCKAFNRGRHQTRELLSQSTVILYCTGLSISAD